MCSRPFRPVRHAVSLIEVVVVIGVIGMLVGLTVPAVQKVRGATERVSCQNRLRQIGVALHNYHDTHGSFPPGQDREAYAPSLGSTKSTSWLAKILPFIDQGPLWEHTLQAFAQDPMPWHNPPHVGLATVIPLYTCPSDPRVGSLHVGPDGILAAYTSYQGVEGEYPGVPNGVLTLGRAVRITDVIDGTSQTVMVGERPPSALLDSGWWYTSHYSAYSHDFILYAVMLKETLDCAPPPGGQFVYGPGRIDNECDMYHFWSLHTGGANFLFADGSVHFLPYSISPLLPALASRDGGEVVILP